MIILCLIILISIIMYQKCQKNIFSHTIIIITLITIIILSITAFDSNHKEYFDDYSNFMEYKPPNFQNQNYFYDYKNTGERLINTKYYNYNYYPKIEINIDTNEKLITDNRYKNKKYTHNSNNIIRDNKYLLNNLNKQIKGYEKQNILNEQLYNSKNNIYKFKNDTHNDQQNSNEWWERYFQLEEEKNNIQNNLNNNSRKIINLEDNYDSLLNNLQQNKTEDLRNQINNNMNKINKKQKCIKYGIDKITQQYLSPHKQNKYYGEAKAKENYTEENTPLFDILNAYKKNPQLTHNLIKKVIKEDQNSCSDIVETKPIYITPLYRYNENIKDNTDKIIQRCSKIKCPKLKCV